MDSLELQKNIQIEEKKTDLTTDTENVSKTISENKEEVKAPDLMSRFDTRMKSVFYRPEKTAEVKTNVEWMVESHKPEYEMVLKKKHLVKKDEYEQVAVRTGKEELSKKKKTLYKKMQDNEFALQSRQIRLQDEVDINVAKYTNFSTVCALSAFAEENVTRQEFNEMVKKYAGGENISKEKADENRFDFLSDITEKIMTMQPGDYDVSTQQRMAESSKKFELMASRIEAYKQLLDSNEDYKKMLEQKKDEGGENYLEKVEERLRKLGNISRYYRVQKLIMEDSLYQNSRNNEISMEIGDNDDFQTKRLKKLLRVAYYMGKNLNGADLPDLSTDSMYSKSANDYAKNIFDKDPNMVEKQIKAASQFKDKKRKESLIRSAKEMRAAQAEAMEKEVKALEFEKFFVPQEELKFSLNVPKVNKDPRFAYLGSTGAEIKATEDNIVLSGKQKLHERIEDLKNNGLTYKSFDVPSFPGAVNFDGNILFGDNFDRQVKAYTVVYSYKRNDDEIMQIIRNLNIARSKDFEKNTKNDPKAKAYYESCYIDAAVKTQALMYSTTKRVANAVGDKPLFMHPKDLIMQDNLTKRSTFVAAATITNSFVEENNNEQKLKDFVKKFNTSGKYPLDMNEMKTLGNANAMITFKMNTWLGKIRSDLSMNKGEIFPPNEIDKVFKWWNDNNEEKLKSPDNIDVNHVAAWLMAEHKDELESGKFFDRVNRKTGKKIFLETFAVSTKNFFTGDLTEMNKLVKSNIIPHTSDKDLEAYFNKLKKEGYTPVGPDNDPYLKEQFKKGFTDFMKDEKGEFNPIGMPYYVETVLTPEEQKRYNEIV